MPKRILIPCMVLLGCLAVLSSCAARNLEPRLVPPAEFVSILDRREVLSDSCRPVYCTYILIKDGDTLRFGKREAGRRIIENVMTLSSGLDSLQLQKVEKIGHFGECIPVIESTGEGGQLFAPPYP